MAGQLVNVLKYLQKRNVLLREFPDFNYDNIPAFKSETEALLIAMGADAVPVLLQALITDVKGAPGIAGLARNTDFIRRVQHILVAIGEEAVEGIVRRLSEPSPRVRRTLLDLLSKIVVDPDFGNDVEGWRRWYSVWHAGRRRLAGRVPALLEALGDEDRRVRVAAARALGEIGSRDAVDPLVRLLPLPGDRTLLTEVVRALAKIGDTRAAPALIDLLGSPLAEARQEAVTALRYLTHRTMGFDPRGEAEEREAAVERWRRWWENQRR
jgi:HEAT repeat protein